MSPRKKPAQPKKPKPGPKPMGVVKAEPQPKAKLVDKTVEADMESEEPSVSKEDKGDEA